MSGNEPVSDEATSRRTEGPTPAGGAYAIAFFSHDGTPVPQRYANQMMIVEYDDADRELMRTFGTTTPTAVLPPNYVPDADAPSPSAGIDLLSFAAGLGRTRLSPRERPISKGPPLATQAVCLARGYVVDGAFRANYSLALRRAAELLEARDDLDGRWLSAPLGGKAVGYMQIKSSGAARASARLPMGVDEADVIVHDLGANPRPEADRLQQVCDALAEDLVAHPASEGELALRLAGNALRSETVASGLWQELLERSRRFVEYFEDHPVSSIPVDMTREALTGLRGDFEEARSHLLLDLATTAGARVVESVTFAVVNADRGPNFDRDAHLRALYHIFNLTLANGPATEEPELDQVAAALTSWAIDNGFSEEVEALAQRELKEADELVELAREVPDGLDSFYWLLFAAALPLRAAEILYRVLAAAETGFDFRARLANLAEEKRVRVTTSVLEDAHHLYTPLLVEARERVQRLLEAEGALRARQEAIDVIDHALTFPRWVESYLLEESAREEDFWEELMAARRPLRSPFAPVRPQGVDA